MNSRFILDKFIETINAIYELFKNKRYLDEKIIKEFFDFIQSIFKDINKTNNANNVEDKDNYNDDKFHWLSLFFNKLYYDGISSNIKSYNLHNNNNLNNDLLNQNNTFNTNNNNIYNNNIINNNDELFNEITNDNVGISNDNDINKKVDFANVGQNLFDLLKINNTFNEAKSEDDKGETINLNNLNLTTQRELIEDIYNDFNKEKNKLIYLLNLDNKNIINNIISTAENHNYIRELIISKSPLNNYYNEFVVYIELKKK